MKGTVNISGHVSIERILHVIHSSLSDAFPVLVAGEYLKAIFLWNRYFLPAFPPPEIILLNL